MRYRRNVILFSVLAAVSAATTAITASHTPVRSISIVLPLVAMGVFLFFAGYFAGVYQSHK